MKIVGIIVEYNPLHNGHVFHVNQIKKLANPDLIIAIMSSSFTMRGDLSLFNKFEKTKQALQNNVDIVVELPLALCCNKADIFALNACKILNLLKVDEIWIGSENNDENIFKIAYNSFYDKDKYIKEQMAKGRSYKEITDEIFPLKSNDLLGYCYYKAIVENNLNISLHTLQRCSSNYLDKLPTDDKIASALAIRNNLNLLDKYTPSYVSNDKDKIYDEEKLFIYLKYKIITTSNNELKQIYFVDEGIEYKLKSIISFNSYEEFINYLVTKRYTKTRIKRMLLYILLNIKKEQMNEIINSDIAFLRVLGFNDKGKTYINKIKKNVTIYTNIKDGINQILDIELKVSRLLDIVYNDNLINKEQKGPIIKNNKMA